MNHLSHTYNTPISVSLHLPAHLQHTYLHLPPSFYQIYEQAKWALISEEIDCTEEEMMVFAALQVGSLLAWQNGGHGEGGGACFLFFG